MKRLLFTAALLAFGAIGAMAQNAPITGPTQVQLTQGLYYLTPISATAAVGTVSVTLTIPAPPSNLYNYVCWLAHNMSDDASGATVVYTNAVTTSTNFGAFALKLSLPAANNNNYDWQVTWGTPIGGGCAKSTSPGTATTFVSSSTANAHAAFTWYATYYWGY